MKTLSKYIQLGTINSLAIDRDTPHGFFLLAENEEDVLLPNAYISDDMKLDDIIDVFIYTDSEDRIVATTLKPLGMLDEYVSLEVVDVAKYGAFMDWGLPKDLLVPRKYQKSMYKIGDTKVIRICEDKDSDRLYGCEDFTKFLKKNTKELKKYEQVDIMVFHKSPLGYKVLINTQYEGIVYQNEIFQEINIGDKLKGYIKTIRNDGKVDISLQPIGKDNTKDIYQDKILSILKENNNKLHFTSKSDVEDIKQTFNMSKKAFKRAINNLKENNTISINDECITLI
jgi:predicted RNA-binding protein (virulence factor B family)